MIKVKHIGGRQHGAIRIPPYGKDPSKFLFETFIYKGENWEINFSEASPEEKMDWGQADFMTRSWRAISKSLPVDFLGIRYTLVKELRMLEEAIISCGHEVKVTRDDESGVQIDIVLSE